MAAIPNDDLLRMSQDVRHLNPVAVPSRVRSRDIPLAPQYYNDLDRYGFSGLFLKPIFSSYFVLGKS